jgi:hypothetical protein
MKDAVVVEPLRLRLTTQTVPANVLLRIGRNIGDFWRSSATGWLIAAVRALESFLGRVPQRRPLLEAMWPVVKTQ